MNFYTPRHESQSRVHLHANVDKLTNESHYLKYWHFKKKKKKRFQMAMFFVENLTKKLITREHYLYLNVTLHGCRPVLRFLLVTQTVNAERVNVLLFI